MRKNERRTPFLKVSNLFNSVRAKRMKRRNGSLSVCVCYSLYLKLKQTKKKQEEEKYNFQSEQTSYYVDLFNIDRSVTHRNIAKFIAKAGLILTHAFLHCGLLSGASQELRNSVSPASSTPLVTRNLRTSSKTTRLNYNK